MKPTYEVRTNAEGQEVIIQTNPDGTIWSFMADLSNSDYQAYLEHEATSK
jgi:hypothetical protein